MPQIDSPNVHSRRFPLAINKRTGRKMTMKSMLDRVAEALCVKDGSLHPYLYRSAAEVAIKAMQQPTDKMVKLGEKKSAAGCTALEIYKGMLAEAVEEPTRPVVSDQDTGQARQLR